MKHTQALQVSSQQSRSTHYADLCKEPVAYIIICIVVVVNRIQACISCQRCHKHKVNARCEELLAYAQASYNCALRMACYIVTHTTMVQLVKWSDRKWP